LTGFGYALKRIYAQLTGHICSRVAVLWRQLLLIQLVIFGSQSANSSVN